MMIPDREATAKPNTAAMAEIVGATISEAEMAANRRAHLQSERVHDLNQQAIRLQCAQACGGNIDRAHELYTWVVSGVHPDERRVARRADYK